MSTSQELLPQLRQACEDWYAGQVEAYRAWVNGGELGKKPQKVKKLKAAAPIGEEELKELGKLPEEWC